MYFHVIRQKILSLWTNCHRSVCNKHLWCEQIYQSIKKWKKDSEKCTNFNQAKFTKYYAIRCDPYLGKKNGKLLNLMIEDLTQKHAPLSGLAIQNKAYHDQEDRTKPRLNNGWENNVNTSTRRSEKKRRCVNTYI